ncbi:MAG: hypothetical protein AAB296_08070, partial [Candidatus Desantisbacteria bacterium]
MRRFTAFIIGMVMLSTLAWAGDKQDGGQTGSFMNLATDARTLSMGRAGVADPQSGVFWNPASTVFITQKKLMVMYASPFPDTTYQIITYQYPFGRWAAGCGILHQEIQDILSRDSNNVIIGNFNSSNDTFLFNAGYLLIPSFSAGIGFKRCYYNNKAAMGLDLGCLFKPTNNMSFGVNLQNFIQPSFGDDGYGYTERIPINIKIGFDGRFSKELEMMLDKIGMGGRILREIRLTLDIDKNSNRAAKIHIGSEFVPYALYSALKFRLGYDQGFGPTAGLGLRFGVTNLDYAWLGHENESMHRMSLALNFGQKEEDDDDDEEKPLPKV